jgi:hypothetical protein
MEAGQGLFIIACIVALGLIPIVLATLVFNSCAPASQVSGGPRRKDSLTGDPWVGRGLKDEHGNITIRGIAYLDGLDGEFDGRFDGPRWP